MGHLCRPLGSYSCTLVNLSGVSSKLGFGVSSIPAPITLLDTVRTWPSTGEKRGGESTDQKLCLRPLEKSVRSHNDHDHGGSGPFSSDPDLRPTTQAALDLDQIEGHQSAKER